MSFFFDEDLETRLLHSIRLRRLFRRMEDSVERGGRPVTFRLSEAEIDVIEQAERVAGTSRSQFLREQTINGGGTTNFTLLANMLDVLVEYIDFLPKEARAQIDWCGAALTFQEGGDVQGAESRSPREKIRDLLRRMRNLKHLELHAAQCDLESMTKGDRELLEFYLDQIGDPSSEERSSEDSFSKARGVSSQ